MIYPDNNFYTFIVTSHINTKHSKIDNNVRYEQTLKTFSSIKEKVPNSVIVFCDSSVDRLDENQIATIDSLVDCYVNFENNLFTRYITNNGYNTGLNEMLVINKLLQEVKRKNLLGKRLFKLSGRYELHNLFDINFYDNPEVLNKYVFRMHVWQFNEGQFYKEMYNTALYSMCSTLVDEYQNYLQEIFDFMLSKSENFEYGHYMCLPKENVVVVPNVYGQGYMKNNQYLEF